MLVAAGGRYDNMIRSTWLSAASLVSPPAGPAAAGAATAAATMDADSPGASHAHVDACGQHGTAAPPGGVGVTLNVDKLADALGILQAVRRP